MRRCQQEALLWPPPAVYCWAHAEMLAAMRGRQEPCCLLRSGEWRRRRLGGSLASEGGMQRCQQEALLWPKPAVYYLAHAEMLAAMRGRQEPCCLLRSGEWQRRQLGGSLASNGGMRRCQQEALLLPKAAVYCRAHAEMLAAMRGGQEPTCLLRSGEWRRRQLGASLASEDGMRRCQQEALLWLPPAVYYLALAEVLAAMRGRKEPCCLLRSGEWRRRRAAAAWQVKAACGAASRRLCCGPRLLFIAWHMQRGWRRAGAGRSRLVCCAEVSGGGDRWAPGWRWKAAGAASWRLCCCPNLLFITWPMQRWWRRCVAGRSPAVYCAAVSGGDDGWAAAWRRKAACSAASRRLCCGPNPLFITWHMQRCWRRCVAGRSPAVYCAAASGSDDSWAAAWRRKAACGAASRRLCCGPNLLFITWHMQRCWRRCGAGRSRLVCCAAVSGGGRQHPALPAGGSAAAQSRCLLPGTCRDAGGDAGRAGADLFIAQRGVAAATDGLQAGGGRRQALPAGGSAAAQTCCLLHGPCRDGGGDAGQAGALPFIAQR